MSEACGCKPGKRETGWQECRCEECVQRERDAWSQMLARYRARLTEDPA